VGIDAFCARAAQLAQQYGPGFAITAKVADAIRSYQPSY
jgi:3-hydroxyacyl-CoA dehydrogenase/enoyl-CoA hydratase/3-hydroxybutyryl-CoA epimerase